MSQGLDTEKRSRSNLEVFCKTVGDACEQLSREQITIKKMSTSPTQNQGPVIRDATSESSREEEHRWLSCMRDFARIIQNTKPPADFQPITIALIDDGVNQLDDQALCSSIIGGQSFSASDDTPNSVTAPYYSSSGGHGTLMASLMCQICPAVQIFVLKLQSFDTKQITAANAAKVSNKHHTLLRNKSHI